MRTESKWRNPALLALLLSLAVPGSVLGQDPDRPEAAGTPEEVEAEAAPRAELAPTLRVANQNWLDIHVYLSREGEPLRSLGMVTSFTTVAFELPKEALHAGSALRIVAREIGGNRRYVSPELVLVPGAEAAVTVENAIHLSSSTIRNQLPEG